MLPCQEADVLKYAAIVFVFVAPVIAGTLVLAILVADMAIYTATPLVAAFFVGLVLAIPASWLIARAMIANGRRKRAA
ncbi:hypothetical protein [Salinarimonas sp.]|uniref:hypothetical protein n=1 Tax=Salinarimonas sp. TaxID=2766526 RepID=UPI00391AB69D